MTEVESLKKLEAELVSRLLPISDELDGVRHRLRKARSVEWIKAHEATRQNVELSDVPGIFFGNVWKFADFLRAKAGRRRFAEWNTVIYHTDDLLDGRMPDMPGRIDDLPAE